MSKNDGKYICTPDCSEQYPGVKLSSILEWANASKCRNGIANISTVPKHSKCI